MGSSPIERLRRYAEQREAAGENQTALAKRIGVSQSALSRILGGRIGVGRDVGIAIEDATKGWRGGRIFSREWKGYVPTPAAEADERPTGETAA